MLPSAYAEIMTERHVAGCCAYPPCENEPRRAYDNDKPVVRIITTPFRFYLTNSALSPQSIG